MAYHLQTAVCIVITRPRIKGANQLFRAVGASFIKGADRRLKFKPGHSGRIVSCIRIAVAVDKAGGQICHSNLSAYSAPVRIYVNPVFCINHRGDCFAVPDFLSIFLIHLR